MSVYLPLDEEITAAHIEEMFMKNKYFKQVCMEYIDDIDDIPWYLTDAVTLLDRNIIEWLWDEGLEARYEARDYIIDDWDKSRHTNPNKD